MNGFSFREVGQEVMAEGCRDGGGPGAFDSEWVFRVVFMGEQRRSSLGSI